MAAGAMTASLGDGGLGAEGPSLEGILERAPGENFPVALRCLPQALRRDLMALYAFARFTDELGDSAPGDRRARLDAWEGELDLAFRGAASHPVMRHLQPTLLARSLPRQPFADLIEANRRDQYLVRMASWPELVESCRYSANPVGRLVLALFAADEPERARRSDDVCTALQVLEHCQDVREDWRAGRIYLPADELASAGVAPEELDLSPAPCGLRAVVAHQVERARERLASAPDLVASLGGWARLAVAGFAAGGVATADALERHRFDPSDGAPRPRRRDGLRHAFRLLAARRSA